ncbi:hypothetical protein Tco_1448922 [Tanacetum coccineum]
MGRDTIQLETAVSTISSEYLLEFTSEYGIAEELHPELLSPGDRIMDFPEDERVFLTVVDWRVSAPKDEMPVAGSYSPEDVVVLNTRRTPIQKQPEALLCLVGLSRRYFLGDDVYPTFLNDDDRGTPSTVKKSPLDFSNEDLPRQITESDGIENQGQETIAPEVHPQENVLTVRVTPKIGLEKEVAAMGPLSTIGEKSTRLETGSTLAAPTLKETPADVSDPDPLSYAKPQSIPEREIAQSSKRATITGDPDSEKSTSFISFTKSSNGIYQPGWGVTNSCRLESPNVCQDVVDHIVSPGYFSELRHLRNEDFLNQYNMNLARQVAMGAQLRLRFEQDVWILKRATKKVVNRDQRIQAREEEIKKLDQEIHSLKSADTEVQGLHNQTKNLEALLEAEVDMKKATEAKNVELTEELESLREERIKTAFEEFKRYEDDKVEQRCAEMDAHLDKLKIRQAFADVVSARLAKGMSEGLQYGIEHGKAGRDLGDVEAYDPEANDKFSDTGKDAPQWICDLRPSSSQLNILIYPEVCDPKDPWAMKEEISLEDAIAANINWAEKKKKCRVVCYTHGVGSAHHARSDGVAVSVSTAAP